MTFFPVWDTIVRQNRPDGASTATSTATERTPSAESVRGRGAGDGPTSGPGDGRGSLPATEGQRERSSALNMGGTTRVRRSRPVTGDESAFLRPERPPGRRMCAAGCSILCPVIRLPSPSVRRAAQPQKKGTKRNDLQPLPPRLRGPAHRAVGERRVPDARPAGGGPGGPASMGGAAHLRDARRGDGVFLRLFPGVRVLPERVHQPPGLRKAGNGLPPAGDLF